MSHFTPQGFLLITDWISAELKRRGAGDYWSAFDDLANYLGQDEAKAKQQAKFIGDDGIERGIGEWEWRAEPRQRHKLCNERARLSGGPSGRLFIRADLRLPLEPGVIDGVAKRVDAGVAAPVTARAAKVEPGRRKSPRKKSVEVDALIRNRINEVLALAVKSSIPPTAKNMIGPLAKDLEGKGRHGYKFESIRKILRGDLDSQVRRGIKGYFNL